MVEKDHQPFSWVQHHVFAIVYLPWYTIPHVNAVKPNLDQFKKEEEQSLVLYRHLALRAMYINIPWKIVCYTTIRHLPVPTWTLLSL